MIPPSSDRSDKATSERLTELLEGIRVIWGRSSSVIRDLQIQISLPSFFMDEQKAFGKNYFIDKEIVWPQLLKL